MITAGAILEPIVAAAKHEQSMIGPKVTNNGGDAVGDIKYLLLGPDGKLSTAVMVSVDFLASAKRMWAFILRNKAANR